MAHEYAGQRSCASMFKQLYLSEIQSEFASENMNVYVCPVPIHEYIQNKFLTCNCEVGVPILSQIIDLNCVVPKAEQDGIKCKQPHEDVLRSMA